MPKPRGISLKNIATVNLDPRGHVRTSLRNTRRRQLALIHPVSNQSFSNRHPGILRISHSPRRRINTQLDLELHPEEFNYAHEIVVFDGN